MFPTIFTAFLYGFLYHFLSFPAFHAFSIYFSKSFTRLLQFPIVFCTISSGCYRIFLHFHYIFPACLLHRHSLFLAVAPVSSMFQQILHPLFWLLSHFPARLLSHFPSLYLFQHFPVDFARFPLIVIMFSCSFYIIYILFVGFQSIHAFLIYFSKIFTRLLFVPFPLVCCIFNIFFQEFYPSPWFFRSFLHHFLWLLSYFPALSLSFSNMFTASS